LQLEGGQFCPQPAFSLPPAAYALECCHSMTRSNRKDLEQKSHSPIDREAERDLPVLLIEVADAVRECCLIDGFSELLLKEHGWAANLHPTISDSARALTI
jgi:hypothetical protein